MIAKPPQHILFVLDYYLPHLGGLEIVFSHIIQGLLQQGHHVGIITTQHFATLPAYEKHEHLTIRRVGRTREQFIRKAFWQILRVAKTYDCIHTTTYASAIPSSIAGRRCNRNVVLTVHEVFGTLWKRYKVRSRPFRFFEWLIFQFRYAAIVAVSAYTQKHLQTLYALDTTKVRLIHNGVDTTFWQEKNINPSQVATFKKTHHLDDKLVLLYYGHSGVSKGLDRLIHALPLLKKHYPTFHFLANIIPGKRDHHLYRLLKKNHVQDYTTLLHGVEQQHLLTIIGSASCVIVPSISEGFGMVAAEVSQLQKPIIVTTNGALPEVVCGKVITLHNALKPHDFLHALDQFVQQKRKNIPQKTFSWEHAIAQYVALYQEITE